MGYKSNIHTIINNFNDCFVNFNSVVFKGLLGTNSSMFGKNSVILYGQLEIAYEFVVRKLILG